MGESGTRFEHEFETRECFAAAVQAALAREWAVVDRRIADLERRSMSHAATEIAAVIEARIAQLWQRGWQPVDVVRSLDRVLGKDDAVLVRRAIASEAQSYAHLGERVAPDWM